MRTRVTTVISLLCLSFFFFAAGTMKATAAPTGEGDSSWKELVAKAQKEGTVSI